MGSKRISPLSLQLFIVDILLIPVGALIASWLRWVLPFGYPLPEASTQLPAIVYLIFTLCWSVALVFVGAYDLQRILRWFNELYRVSTGSLLAIVIAAGVLYMTFREISRLQFIYIFLTVSLLLIVHRSFLRSLYRAFGKSRPGWGAKILIIGAGALGQRLAEILQEQEILGYETVGFLDDDPGKANQSFMGVDVLGKILDVKSISEQHNIDEVWIALPVWALDRVNLILFELERLPVRIKVVPDYFSMALVQAKSEILSGIPVIGLRDPLIEGLPRIIKRTFDLLVSCGLILLLSPLMLIIAIVIRIDSPGGVIFRQERVGENGRMFDMLKFRTMVEGAETQQEFSKEELDSGELVHKRPNDPRVTRVGWVLRRFSLDELPQLFNVIKADMSLVGPRPEMPWLVDRYDSWQRKRFAVPQGITGWWQINGRSDKPMHLNTDDDLYYVYNYSLWLDILILMRTPLAILRGRGAF
jgi:exopolysaccharide biosynthesis polyprenyl glycosylphosphotransferase